jgi:hypothetical protein
MARTGKVKINFRSTNNKHFLINYFLNKENIQYQIQFELTATASRLGHSKLHHYIIRGVHFTL